MKISIIIPFYNTEKYVERILNSIKSQKYHNYEIICVDDGSTDNTLEALNKYQSDNMVVFHQKNSGPGIARKNGFKLATGDLIYFMDSDDYLIDNNFLTKINKIFTIKKPDIIMFNTKTLNDDNQVINIPSESLKEEGLYDISFLQDSSVSAALMCKVFKRNLLKEEMFFNSNIFEDYYTTYLYLNICKSFYYINEEMYVVYHKNDNNNHLTLVQNFDKYQKTLEIIVKTYEKVTNQAIKKSISYYCQNVIIDYIIKIFKRQIPKSESKIIRQYMKVIFKITKENNIKYKPKSKYKFLKMIIYKYFEIIYG